MVDNILEFSKASDDDDDFYKVLGCDPSSNIDQIKVEYKNRIITCHPDKCPEPEAKTLCLKLHRAKDVLCDEEKRRDYDRWRSSGLCISYDQWVNLRDHSKTSLHWATPKTKLMLVQAESVNKESLPSKRKICSPTWERHTSNKLLRQFRNYQI